MPAEPSVAYYFDLLIGPSRRLAVEGAIVVALLAVLCLCGRRWWRRRSHLW